MTLLALGLPRAGGLARAALVGVCTALVSALLLVCAAVLRLPEQPEETLFNIVADSGVRPGTLVAVGLLTLPPLLLLHQAVRLGTSARDRRLAALRLAGATPGDVRRIGAVEVGVPAVVGGLVGILLYHVLRAGLGGADPRTEPAVEPGSPLHLVPTTVGPTGWQVALVVLGVGLLGAGIGWWGSSGPVVSPWGLARRQPGRPPRPWGVLLLALALLLVDAPDVVRSVVDPRSTGYALTTVVVAVLGMIGLANSAAYWTGRVAEATASSAPTLLAARRLVTDPRPAGRAAAAVGGIALVSGGTSVFIGYVVSYEVTDAVLVASLGLVVGALLAALVVVIGSLAVHSTETLLDQKRSMAALVAQGASTGDLARSQRRELVLASLPVTFLGVVLGSVTLALVAGGGSIATTGFVVLANLVLTPALVLLAAALATALTRPLVRRAASPEHLRTE